MLISGQSGKYTIWAFVPADGPDGEKAKALKPGDRVKVEGEITGMDVGDKGRGHFNMDPAKIGS